MTLTGHDGKSLLGDGPITTQLSVHDGDLDKLIRAAEAQGLTHGMLRRCGNRLDLLGWME